MNIYEPSFRLFLRWIVGVSYLNSVLPLGEVDGTLAELVGGLGTLVLGETAADLASELGAEVEREVLLVLVEQTQLSALVGVDDSENTSDRLANLAARKKNFRQYQISNIDGPSIVRGLPDRVIHLFLVDPLVECWRNLLARCLARVLDRSHPADLQIPSAQKMKYRGVSNTHIL